MSEDLRQDVSKLVDQEVAKILEQTDRDVARTVNRALGVSDGARHSTPPADRPGSHSSSPPTTSPAQPWPCSPTARSTNWPPASCTPAPASR
ncbi:hypothetical protein [Streptomyces sp. NBC_00453]|uniref:hypothetical protein n=1 Tax=Streptomyces sp. NBC_00453 TaxID=2903653 RepID=UPI002E1A5122